jgi:integrase
MPCARDNVETNLRLTELSISSLKPPERGARLYHDESLTGFCVRVSQAGTKSYCLTMGRGRERVTIGRVGVVSLRAARERAREMLAEKTLGKTRAPRLRFSEALEQFYTAHVTRLRPSTQREVRRLLTKHLARFKHEQLAEVSTHALTRVIDGMRATPGEAEHLHRVTKTFFRWAVRRRLIPHSPLEGVDAPARGKTRERVLTDAELAAVFSTAQRSGQFGALVQLLILTGQRKGEIVGLRAEMIDANTCTVALPSEIVKNKRQHVFPYGDMVARVFGELPKTGLLLRGRRRGKQVSADAIPFNGFSKGMDQFRTACGIDHWTLHDLRRTLATGMARLGVQPHCIEALLNHVSGTLSPVAQIYNRHSYLPEARAAIERWETHVAALVAAHNAERKIHTSSVALLLPFNLSDPLNNA